MKRSRQIVLQIFATVCLGSSLGVASGVGLMVFSDLPQVENLETYRPLEVTTFFDRHGKVIHEVFRERRHPVDISDIPENVQKAFLAAEDWRFYEHFGLDIRGVLRAAVKNVLQGRFAQGASTITQQLSKVLFLSPEKTLRRKLKEALLAIQIERKYSKKEILELYLNQIYLGEGSYGVVAAAQTYFEKDLADLDIHEIALLAGLPKAPSRFSPLKDPERALARRNQILQEMYIRKLISNEERRQAMEEDLPSEASESFRQQDYFSAYVRKKIEEELGEERLFRGGLEVFTTLDADLQAVAEEAVARGLTDYQSRHPEEEEAPQTALLSMDARTGEVRALVGGVDFLESQFIRATQAFRQPGSAFKPIVYLAAIEEGYTQSTLISDEAIQFRNPDGTSWKPENYDGEFIGRIPLRVALEKSKNVATIRLLKNIGIPKLRDVAQRLGIQSTIEYNLTSALGSSSMSLLEMVQAYATIASGGLRPEPKVIRSIQTLSGEELWPTPIPSRMVLDEIDAFILKDMLSGVIQSGTGQFAKDLPCAVGGKTGTTNDYVDAWFLGFSEKLTTGVWVGFDQQRSLGFGETGARAAGPVWKVFMQEACREESPEFYSPKGIDMVEVDHSSGKLPSPYCTDVISEAFKTGTAPKDICNEENSSLSPFLSSPKYD